MNDMKKPQQYSLAVVVIGSGSIAERLGGRLSPRLNSTRSSSENVRDFPFLAEQMASLPCGVRYINILGE